MDNERKIYLGEKLKAAAASGNKVHVISKEGQWAIFKEGATRVTASFATRQSAVSNAKKIFHSGEIKTLVVHKRDGSVYSVESIQDEAI